jgi:hypothetical protein
MTDFGEKGLDHPLKTFDYISIIQAQSNITPSIESIYQKKCSTDEKNSHMTHLKSILSEFEK